MYSAMVQSMTGFGSAEDSGCRVEVRSVNHRFLETYIKAPSFLNQSEVLFRNMVKEHCSRGKVDVFVSVTGPASTQVSIDTGFVKKVYEAFGRLREEVPVKGEIDINALVGLHERFIEVRPAYDPEQVAALLRRALEDLKRMREAEGAALAAEILRMTGSLLDMNGRIKAASGRVVEDIRAKFAERLKTLLEGADVDSGRMLQEAAIIAARLDIAEELTRIESHIGQFREILEEGGIIGRKLDFLLQELNREVNTIASKSSDYDISRTAVEMKTEIERIREQVQNIQ